MARTQHLRLQAEADTAALRPVYPEQLGLVFPERDAPLPPDGMVCRTQEDCAAYPDLVYSVQAAHEKRCRRRAERRRRAAAEDDFPPPDPMPPAEETADPAADPETEEADLAPLPASRAESSAASRRDGALWALAALMCTALLALLCNAVLQWYREGDAFRRKKAVVSQETLAQGVLIDGVHVGGMTKAEAARALQKDAGAQDARLHLTVQVDGQTWIITPDELPFQRNIDSVLDTAYAVGRQGTAETIASTVTPFEYRYQHLYHTVESPVALHTQVTYDPAAVRRLVGIIEANINRQAVDAQVATFDFASRAFTFTEDRAGARLDGDALYEKIVAALDRRDLQAVVTAESQPITPRVTKAELMNSFSLISSFSTQTTSSANRNTNIDLASRAVNGTVVMPGETFSFNEATGQRTAQKGYLPAAAIAGGATVDEIGGGVCQVSSTLFNAAAMADMTILSRSPHTWPSTYVDKGRDATVNWPKLDFTFRNDKDTPIFIAAWYQQRTCTVEIYGAVMEGGGSITLETRLTAVNEPPDEPLYERNAALPQGTVQEKKKARTGYTVETYKVYRRGGREIRRELLCVSDYQMIQQVLEYN